MSNYLDPPPTLLLLDFSIDNSFLLVAGLLVENFPYFGISVVSMDTSSLVTMSSQIIAYVAYQ
jgi:hypothetical protein